MGCQGWKTPLNSFVVSVDTSTPFHPILRFQQDDKWPDARRASAGLAIAHSNLTACRKRLTL